MIHAQIRRMKRASRALIGLLGLLAACGGKSAVQSDDASAGAANGGGASGGSAGTSNSPSGGSAGASPTSICPSSAPALGSACNYVGGICPYQRDQCSWLQVECVAGVWTEAPQLDGASYTCANFRDGDMGVPKDGQACTCLGMLDCTINACDTAGQVHAVCDNTSWHVTTTPCADKPCGTAGLTCKPDEICVAPGGLGDKYNCKPNPCVDQSETTSCNCAASLCSSFEICSVNNGQLSCDCPTCGG